MAEISDIMGYIPSVVLDSRANLTRGFSGHTLEQYTNTVLHYCTHTYRHMYTTLSHLPGKPGLASISNISDQQESSLCLAPFWKYGSVKSQKSNRIQVKAKNRKLS